MIIFLSCLTPNTVAGSRYFRRNPLIISLKHFYFANKILVNCLSEPFSFICIAHLTLTHTLYFVYLPTMYVYIYIFTYFSVFNNFVYLLQLFNDLWYDNLIGLHFKSNLKVVCKSRLATFVCSYWHVMYNV